MSKSGVPESDSARRASFAAPFRFLSAVRAFADSLGREINAVFFAVATFAQRLAIDVCLRRAEAESLTCEKAG